MLTEGYCINLSSRQDRWHLMQKQASHFPLDFKLHRFEAIVDRQSPRLGCANSHISILNLAHTEGREYVFVLEDDALLIESGIDYLNTALNNIPSDWDILMGGHYESEVISIDKSGLAKSNFIQCTHCIIYRDTSYKYFREYDGVPIGIDDYISHLASTKKINLYLINPSVATQVEGHSNIKNTYFDWNNQNEQLKSDYSNYRDFFNSLYNDELVKMMDVSKKIKNIYLREQVNSIIDKHSKMKKNET